MSSSKADFHDLFLQDIPLIDTRSPGEFNKGSFPAATSLPLMTDTERAKVGTCYKNSGQAAAIDLGHQLVKGDIKQQRVNAWLDFAKRHPEGWLFCWRGGLRSDITRQWMQEAGVDYPKVPGGYKALRRFLIDTTEQVSESTPIMIIAGKTGSGKTHLLAQLDSMVDLEGIAHHRGSAFGNRPSGQPSQLSFENALAIALLKNRHIHKGPLFLEDESGFIGSCSLPLCLHQAMQNSPRVVVDLSVDDRVENILQDYVIGLLDEHRHYQPENAFQNFCESLQNAMNRIRKRLGNELYSELVQDLQAAFDAMQQRGDNQKHRVWIEKLLLQYYDPMYEYQMSKSDKPMIFKGNTEEVIEWCREQEKKAGKIVQETGS